MKLGDVLEVLRAEAARHRESERVWLDWVKNGENDAWRLWHQREAEAAGRKAAALERAEELLQIGNRDSQLLDYLERVASAGSIVLQGCEVDGQFKFEVTVFDDCAEPVGETGGVGLREVVGDLDAIPFVKALGDGRDARATFFFREAGPIEWFNHWKKYQDQETAKMEQRLVELQVGERLLELAAAEESEQAAAVYVRLSESLINGNA